MKILIYTCVFGGYDWTFSPIKTEAKYDYYIITDNPSLAVKGWKVLCVDISAFENAQTANRYYKTMIHRVFNDYDYSIYLDGNIRLLGKISKLIEPFILSNAALGLYKHPLRNSVQEEANACIQAGKIKNYDKLNSELNYYYSDGFPDNVGLIEATILFKKHQHFNLDFVMQLWWSLFEKFGTRDQISLPYVLWKTDAPCFYHTGSFRDPNPYFGIYTHRGDSRAPEYYSYVEGRSYDSFFFLAILKVWRLSWEIRRFVRRSFLFLRGKC